MRPRLDSILRKQILSLLKKSHEALVKVSESSIPGAGKGVFSKNAVLRNEVPKVACLYPGVYTPGIPIHAAVNALDSSPNQYLANGVPPSGVLFDENAYIMNLQVCGGYIDACALTNQSGGRMDENPAACGHFINHCTLKNNVEVIPFFWDDVLYQKAAVDDADQYYPLPNSPRTDGSPWYFDGLQQEIVFFEGTEQESKSTQAWLECGASMVITKPLESEEELLLDYGLKAPYPKWAEWYDCK